MNFPQFQLEAFGGIFWMINVWDEWSGPRVFPHHMEKKKTSLDANGEQMFHGEIGWPETSDTRGRFQGKWWWEVKLWVSIFFFLDKSQGASDLDFNPTSTKPLGWTRNMFFFEPTTWRQKNPEKILSCLFQDKHGSMDFEKKNRKKSVLSSAHGTAVDKCTHRHQHHHDQRNSNTTCGSHKASSPTKPTAPKKTPKRQKKWVETQK